MRQQAPWTSEDVTAVQTIGNILGPITVLSHKETRMTTETAPADFTGADGDNGWAEATGVNALNAQHQATYPEYPYSLADHVYTWSPKLPDGSMLVIRAQSADNLLKAVEDALPVVQRVMTAWRAATGQPQAPTPAPQGGVNYNPQTPPPNQPFPGQPAWQQAGAPATPAPQWAPPAQQGAQVPQGWYKLTVPFPQKASFDAIVAQYNFTKGDPGRGGQVSWQKAVKSWYCAPEIAQAFAQFNPVVAQ
jgi:hypothetical protein